MLPRKKGCREYSLMKATKLQYKEGSIVSGTGMQYYLL